MIDGIVTAAGMLIAASCIMYLSYWGTKRIGKGFSGISGSRQLKIVDSLQVGMNRNIAIIKAGKSYHLVGITSNQITYLAAIEEDDLENTGSSQDEKTSLFRAALEQYEKLKIKQEKRPEQEEVDR